MKWSELPQEYKDLEKGFHPRVYHHCDKNSESIITRFDWYLTQQGYAFWDKVAAANHISELPTIPYPFPAPPVNASKNKYFCSLVFSKHTDTSTTVLDLFTEVIEAGSSDEAFGRAMRSAACKNPNEHALVLYSIIQAQ